ncbi:MAG: Cupredoxin [Monoraphidium minutum]|nr:MAG: Cupredoxin [Monoraphidium minutum]
MMRLLMRLLLAAAAMAAQAGGASGAACPALPSGTPKPARTLKLFAARLPGSKTQTLAYNGSAVGPLIRLRLGERVRIAVTNKDITAGTSVHWHGQDLQGAAWADGVAGVSQAPIPPGATFSYEFEARPAGTFWYHSHTGSQFGDGLRGPLVVDDPEDPLRLLYDYDLDEHVLLLADVFNTTVEAQLSKLKAAGMAGMGGGGGMAGGGMAGMAGGAAAAAAPDAHAGHGRGAGGAPVAGTGRASLAGGAAAPAAGSGSGSGMGMDMGMGMGMAGSGMAGIAPSAPAPAPAAAGAHADHGGGRRHRALLAAAPAPSCPGAAAAGMDLSDAPWWGAQAGGRGGPGAPPPPPRVITVAPGKRYRLRLIGGQSSWALRVSVGGGHALNIIALDGRPVVPRAAGSIVISSGERVDAVLAADRPVGNYWVEIANLDGRSSPAVLHYEGAPDPLIDPKLRAARAAARGCAAPAAGAVLDLKNATFEAAPGSGGRVPQAANRTFVLYLADAAMPAPSAALPPPLAAQAAAAPPRGFSPSLGGRCPAAGGAPPPKYCWSLNWNVFEPPAAPLIWPGSVPAPRTLTFDAVQGDVVDVVLVNPSRMVHPQHLHGTGFWLLASGNGDILSGAARAGAALALSPSAAKRLNLRDPPVRDTIAVPQAVGDGAGGYGFAVLRFRADNPGPWAFHCHIDLHAMSGMMSVIAVRPKPAPRGGAAAAWFAPKGAACGAAP